MVAPLVTPPPVTPCTNRRTGIESVSELGDCFKTAKIRREAVQKLTGRSVEGLPLEGFYDSILGQCCEMLVGVLQGKVPFVSSDGIHQLHIFIFVLAIFHVVCCLITLALSRAKMRKGKAWEKESRTIEYQYSHDSERFRFARDTSFGRRHMSTWSQ
ncbi:hypothetical protein CASFOL_023683 [Castilleja foliolosa]|uniref:Uncharacterized protein n=1 Tax=Castilleja foliolosa TaxID=1961234 RepID=A0ABD3CN86_9LAMI